MQKQPKHTENIPQEMFEIWKLGKHEYKLLTDIG